MSAEEVDDPERDGGAFDLEAEWPEAKWFKNRRPESDREPLWILPVFLLYTGFFFGPFVTLLAAVFALKGRIPVRMAAFLTGVAGTAWCLLQGLSVLNGPVWSEYVLQGMRSGSNFAFGIIAYVAVRRVAVRHFQMTRTTIAVSAGAVVLGGVVFLLLPNEILIALGR
jgi:hypothetical protein